MKRKMMIAALFILPIGLSGCDKKPEAPKVEAAKAGATADTMPNMEMPVGSKMGKGFGTVTAVDAVTGKITLDHGAIQAIDWPAMTMQFSAKPDLLAGVAIGDKVEFDITVSGSAGEVTAITKL